MSSDPVRPKIEIQTGKQFNIPKEGKAKKLESGRLYVKINDKLIAEKGIEMTSSSLKANLINTLGKLWGNIKNAFSHEAPSQIRNKYVPITLKDTEGKDKVYYININSFMKRLALAEGEDREEYRNIIYQ